MGETRRKGRRTPGAFAIAAVLALGAASVLAAVGAAQEKAAQQKPAQPAKKDTGAGTDTVRQLELAVQKDSTNFDKNYRLGIAYLDHDRALEAVSTFQRATRLRPKEVKAWVNLGAAQDAMGHGPEARTSYRKALELAPEDEIALCRIGASLYASGSKAAAMDTLRTSLKKHPSSYCTYFTLGVAFADAQIYREAIRCWEKVIELAPNTPEALSAKESINTLREMMKTP